MSSSRLRRIYRRGPVGVALTAVPMTTTSLPFPVVSVSCAGQQNIESKGSSCECSR